MSINNGVPTAYPPRESPTPRESSPRLYVFEPGWRVSIKRDSQREFCHMMTPGQNYYHRLRDGELFLHHGDERLCLSCAARRGLVTFEPRLLRNPIDHSLADSSELPVFDPDSGDLEF
jgi:hypothetical protein